MNFPLLRHNIFLALKQNMIPGLFLQALALTIALCYFFLPESQPVFNYFSELKLTYGWVYAAIATALFGGLIPFVYLYVSGQIKAQPLYVGLFYMCFWAYKGVEVNYLYHYQGVLFGHEANFSTIASKTAVDQFIYSALWACPSIVVAYLWMEQGFNLKRWREGLTRELFTMKIPTVVISNWLIWIPAVSVVYLMPPELQVPLFNLVLCFFVLLLAVLNRK